MDDIIVTGHDVAEKAIIKECLAEEFEMKELGKLKYFLALKWLTLKKAPSFLNRNILLSCLGRQER